jgi:histidinol-phosphate aminotransferase
MEKYIILIFLILILVVFIISQRKLSNETEHFQSNFMSTFNSFLDTIKYEKNEKKEKRDLAGKKKIEKYKSMNKMKDEKILITGATSGIGYIVAKYVTRYDCKIYVTGKDAEKVKKLISELKILNTNIFGQAFDLAKDKSVNKLSDHVKKTMGVPTVLFNCAFKTKSSSYISTKSEKDWKLDIDLNIKANILLSQRIGYEMYKRKISGRIINFSSYKAKNTKTNYLNPDKIVTESMIEKFSNVFSDEMFEYNIGITVIRLDDDIATGKLKFLNFEIANDSIGKMFDDVFSVSPKKITPIIDYAIRIPFKQITGKVISTENFENNRDLMPIVAPNKLKNDKDIYNKVIYTKTISRKDSRKYITLTKQNPYDPSPKFDNFLKKGVKNFNKFNTLGKYDMILDNVIAKKNNVTKEQIVFFKTEFDAIKRIFELFLSKGSEIITTNPPWAFLELCATETKAVLDITTLSPNGKNLEINFSFISYTPKTKIIYLSSPNNVSGQCIRNTTSFKKFLKDLPENVLLIIDERYIEFVKKDVMEKPPIIDSLKILKEHKNIIILRSFNNFYSIENLEISYLITSKNIASLFKNSQIINQVDKFTEKMALIVINDPYYEKIKEKIYDERVRIMQTLTKSNIEFYHSDINFFLVKTQSKRDDIMVELEEENIVLYNSMDGYNNYWTLPLGKPETNDIVLNILRYDNLE